MSIESDIATLQEHFSRVSQGLFEITGKYHTSYDQGIYGCTIAKPTKRMRSALGIDREILIVASTFSDQQQRIIKFIKKEIEASHGRYEHTIAIIIHQDTDGNLKLKNWGRDQGISILPIYGIAQLKSANELERALCVELYSHDPFDVTGPVSDDSNFFGRRDEAIDLARKLQKGQIRSCLGIRKIGKTSIINRILREIATNYNCTCLMIDCSRDDIWSLDAAQLLRSIEHTIHSVQGGSENYASIAPIASSAELKTARDSLQASVLECEHPLVLVFDEIDYITPGSPTQPLWRTEFNLFWRNLRSIYQECDRRGHTMSILIGGVSTYWFSVESIDGIENAALSFIPEEYLSPMPEGATVAMLRRLSKVGGLQFINGAAELVASATGNMPYWARKCCSYIHRRIPISERPCSIDPERAQPLIEAFIAEEGAAISEVALRHLFRVHPGLQDATDKCFHGQAASVPEPLKRVLRRYGVTSSRDELSGAMLSQAFSSLISATVQQPKTAGTTEASEQTTELSEWAEELAALGKRRNILEKKLRDIAVNFIRFDALTKGSKEDIRERVLKTLPAAQRKKLQHLSAEDIVTKFMWSDLTKLIIKEWPLFERLFGDKGRFVAACDIINDRFDAHAKTADKADFALYRRSLNQLEQMVAQIA